MLLRSLASAILLLPLALNAGKSPELTSEQLTFFETNIRPALIESCYECHAEDSEKLKGGLLLDSKAGWMRGGDTGPVILPGDAENSLFMHMIRHDPSYDAMPPKSKLSDAQIAHFAKWINEGAYDPRDQAIGQLKNVDEFDLEARKQWWSFQPIKDYGAPSVNDPNWSSHAYDNFILAALDEKGWKPAPKASKRSLLRRLSFDLIGLAPTPEEMDAFLADASQDAYAKQVDRLLASPHFGEKWARHWMDAVRYAETKSFEFDYLMPHAHQYRNYLIRAFNEDVPYDQFVRESFAGDLVDEPRFDESGTVNESVKGPGFFYLTDGQHGPPDLHDDEARIFSGMIDATSKAFLGMTVACARCHDHKFDAITTGDYYSWYGMLRSSRLDITNTVVATKQLVPQSKLRNGKSAVYDEALADATRDVANMSQYSLAMSAIEDSQEFQKLKKTWAELKKNRKAPKANLNKELIAVIHAEASQRSLDPIVLESWFRYYSMPNERKKWPQLDPIYRAIIGNEKKTGAKPLAPITAYYPTDLNEWMATGLGFSEVDSDASTDMILSVKNDHSVVQSLVDLSNPTAGVYSGRISGSLRSPDFILDGRPVEIYARGKNARVNVIVRNYEQAGFGPTTRILTKPVNQGSWQRISVATKLWVGQPAYIEVLQDSESRRLKSKLGGSADDNYVSISTDPKLPDWRELWKDRSVTEVAEQLIRDAQDRKLTPGGAVILSGLFEAGLIRAGTDRSESLKSLIARYREINNEIPQPVYARSLTEGTPQDEPIYIRGSHKNLSKESNPRRNLDALGGQLLTPTESGRREFADYLVDESNPLVARVMVNRIWHYIFGRGIVSSIDDLGELGSLPSHPELLDYLARDFMVQGWSIKQMIRKMVLTSTYQMSTLPDEQALALDPNNVYLQRMPVKRLEAEQIRDHILFVSGQLNPELYGPSVKSFTNDLPKARGFPGSGPVDGNGRRSVYMELRRNFMPSFLRILGMPNGVEPIGARNVTNVPAQSLAMMNAEFTQQQAKEWATSLLESEVDEVARIHQMHQMALSRDADEAEVTWAQSLVREVAQMYQENGDVDEVAVWQELCHVMMNRKEFIYLF
ncbi:MAG: PSD1 and planctomycete cytochrome C domain-containing protein [Opitutaceae bacterium]